jgi:polyribonucleotide 5'-hydroxyl-kinase
MKRRFPPSNHERAVTVIRLDKSGGCVDRDEDFMRKLRQIQVREYFYGQPSMALSPTTQVVDFSQIAIFRIIKGTPHGFTPASLTSSASSAPASFDPGADADDDDEYDPTALPGSGPSGGSATAPLHEKVEPSPLLQNALLAVTTAQAKDGLDGVRDASVLWYVYVTDVDEVKQRLRLLSPISGRVPANALVWGDWPESVPDLAA